MKRATAESFRTRLSQTLPGVAVALLVALAALGWDGEVRWLNGVILAILGGAVVGNLLPSARPVLKPGVDFCLKWVLKAAIILLGLQFSLLEIWGTGGQSLAVVLAVVILGLLVAYGVGRVVGLNGKLAWLIGVGTSICGATAIATIAPVIEAEEQDVAVSIGTIFLLNSVAIILYPLIGKALGMSELAFGTWVGTTVHDTSAVLATGFAFGEQAGMVSTVVKLTRTLMLIPLTVIFGMGIARQRAVTGRAGHPLAGFPWFISGFVLLAALSTWELVPRAVSAHAGPVSRLFIGLVMAAVGLALDGRRLKAVGLRFLYTGLSASAVVSIFSLWLIYLLGIG